MKKVGIMGGTFNPIHCGHLLLAESVKDDLNLDEIWFIPTGVSYMKRSDGAGENAPTPLDRYEMTRLALANCPDFKCKDIEILRSGNTYTYETLEYYSGQYPDYEFYFIMGADCLYDFDRWKYPERILKAAHLVACVRGAEPMEKLKLRAGELERLYNGSILVCPFRNLELSSTEIRERVRTGQSIRFMTPFPVIDYIEEKGFYRD